MSYDIVCVGAGISGLYLAYKLMNENPEKSIILIDKLDRVGGKLISVPLEGVKYEAEGCAMRFMSHQTMIHQLMDDMGMTYTEVGFSAKSVSDSNILESLSERGIRDDDYKISNLDGITNWPSIEEGDYMNAYKANAVTGYGYASTSNNMFSTQDILISVQPDSVQYYPDGGFNRLARLLADKIRTKYPIHLQETVWNVNQNYDTGGYEVVTDKDTYQCEHIVFTGDRNALNQLGGSSSTVRDLKEFLYRHVGADVNYTKLYLEVKDPWWTEEDIGSVINSIGPVMQFYYSNKNTICVYNDSGNADMLFYMIPQKYRHLGVNDINWISMEDPELNKLSQFIRHYVTKMVVETHPDDQSMKESVRVIDFTKMAFKYTTQATLLYAPSEYPLQSIITILNNYNNIHLVSDAYYMSSGWIESAISSVEATYPSIVQ